MKLRSVIQWLAGLVLAGAGLWIFFRNIDTHRLAGLLLHSSPWLIISCAVLAVLAIWFRSLRSALLLPVCTKAQKKNLFPILMISFMINNILPARMGEAARAMLLWKRNGYSGAVSVGSIILERILDTIVYLSSFFIPVFLVSDLAGSNVGGARALTMHSLALAFLAGFSFFVALFIAYSRFPQKVRLVAGRIAATRFVPVRFRPRLSRIGIELISNLEWTFSAKRVAGIIVLSYAIMSCYAVMAVLLIDEKTFGYLHGLFAQAFAAMGAAVPLAPGYVGTLHAVFLQGLVLCGVEREKAVAATIFFHAVAYIAVTGLGLYYYFKFGVSFKDISNASKDLDKSENTNPQRSHERQRTAH
jgi:glycosyltransferase 2 family protein